MLIIVRTLCGLLTLTGLAGCTAPKVDHVEVSPKSRLPREKDVELLGLDVQPYPLLELISLDLDKWGSKTIHVTNTEKHRDVAGSSSHLRSRLRRMRMTNIDKSQIFGLFAVAGLLVCCLLFLMHNVESEEDGPMEATFDPAKGGATFDNAAAPITKTMGQAGIREGARVAFEFKGDVHTGTVQQLPEYDGGPYVVRTDFSEVQTQVSTLRLLQDIPSVAQCFCGSPFTEESIFCKTCGRPRYCPCGSPFLDDAVFCRKCGKPRFEAGTQEDPIHQVEFSDGSWARAFREARGQRRDALELLLKCNIISTQEFAYSRVSQEHIDECVWIGTHMLKQKPLEEWVALWQQAQQTFEDSVTACFSARTDARSSYGPISGRAPRSEVPLLDCHNAASQAISEDEDPYTTRSSLHISQHLMSPSGIDYAEQLSQYRKQLDTPQACVCGGVFMDDAAFCRRCGKPRAEVAMMEETIHRNIASSSSLPPSSSSLPPQRLLSPMILRCSEIMAAPPQEGVPAQLVPAVLRSSSTATTVQISHGPPPRPVLGQEWRSDSEPSVSPMTANITPSLPSLSPFAPLISPSISPSFPSRSPPEVSSLPSGQSSRHMSPQPLSERALLAPQPHAPVATYGLPPGALPPSQPSERMMMAASVATESSSEAPDSRQNSSLAIGPAAIPVQPVAAAASFSEVQQADHFRQRPSPRFRDRMPEGLPMSSGELMVAHLPGNQGSMPEGSPMQLSPLLQPSMKEVIRERMAGAGVQGYSSPRSMSRVVEQGTGVEGPPAER